MTWVRIDDGFARHPKVVAAGPLAMAMQVAALCYCNRELTDGFVPRAVARTLLDFEVEDGEGRIWMMARTCGMQGDDVSAGWVIDTLVEAGMWREVPGGYVLHDYHEYQPTKEQVLRDREQGAKRQAAWRERQKEDERNAISNGVTNGVSNGPVTDAPYPYPVPTPVPIPEPTPTVGADAPVRAKPRKRIPADWALTEELREYATKHGIPDAMVDEVADEFKRYWVSDGRPKADWGLTFMGRVRDVAARYQARTSPNGHVKPEERRPSIPSVDEVFKRQRPAGEVRR